MQIDDKMLNSACMSYRHDFGLLTEVEKDAMRFQAKEWLIAWGKEGLILPSPDMSGLARYSDSDIMWNADGPGDKHNSSDGRFVKYSQVAPLLTAKDARINGFEGLIDDLCAILKCKRDIGDIVIKVENLTNVAKDAKLVDVAAVLNSAAPKDGTEFLSTGGAQGNVGVVYPTKYFEVGPYSTENGKNSQGERRYQYPSGFYWAGYDGFVGPVDPTHWMPLPAALNPSEPRT